MGMLGSKDDVVVLTGRECRPKMCRLAAQAWSRKAGVRGSEGECTWSRSIMTAVRSCVSWGSMLACCPRCRTRCCWMQKSTRAAATETFRDCAKPDVGITTLPSDAATAASEIPYFSLPNIIADGVVQSTSCSTVTSNKRVLPGTEYEYTGIHRHS